LPSSPLPAKLHLLLQDFLPFHEFVAQPAGGAPGAFRREHLLLVLGYGHPRFSPWPLSVPKLFYDLLSLLQQVSPISEMTSPPSAGHEWPPPTNERVSSRCLVRISSHRSSMDKDNNPLSLSLFGDFRLLLSSHSSLRFAHRH